MNIHFDQSTIRARHSVRRYLPKPLAENAVAELNALIQLCNAESGLHFQLVTDEPNAYGKSFWAGYGKFSGVRNYICLIGPPKADEAIGYFGEALVLKAMELGLNSCWCGLSYSKRNAHFTLAKGEKLHGLIALGYGENGGVASKSKAPGQVAPDYDQAPQWFRQGVDSALLAPSAINQQKFRFRYVGDRRVEATTLWGPYSRMDLGIAKFHFEQAAAPVRVEWV